MLMIEYAGDSIERFSRQSQVPVATLRSYLDRKRAPSAAVLYKLWRALGISPTYLLTGEGQQVMPPREHQLSSWSPQLLGDADSNTYGGGTTVKHHLDEETGILSIRWTFATPRPHRRGKLGGHAPFLWAGEAGVMAHFNRAKLPGGCNWGIYDGLLVRARSVGGKASLGVKLKTGVTAQEETELGLRLDLDPEEVQHAIRFGDLRKIDRRFDPKHVRTLCFAMTRDMTTGGRGEALVDLRELTFIPRRRA
jgi:hypothetical protein